MWSIMKTLFDKTLAFVLIIFFAPIYIAVAFLIWWKMGTPILFRQLRPGYKEKIFGIYKFRTMTNEVDENGELLPDEERLKGIGKFIRTTSLDELPQLFNVLKGEMSFVGPRPLLVEYLPLYNEEQKRRHDVLPGITGWAQVNGRNAISWEQKFEYDVWYVDNKSFLLDIKILWMTFLKVIGRKDISSSSSATMEKFKGEKL
jgi:undecaprenyl phosphate N,N'-diacetylbacillosamine 1-phosphate transferase